MDVRRVENVMTDNFKTPIQFPVPDPDDVWVRGEDCAAAPIKPGVREKIFSKFSEWSGHCGSSS